MNGSRSRYLVVGGGMTGDAVCQGIRSVDADGGIVLVGEEPDPPAHHGPPLSKGLWSGADESSIWRDTAARGVDLRLGRRVVALDLAGRRALDDLGEAHQFERLVLATGAAPRRLGGRDEEVVYFRTLASDRRVRALNDGGASFAVIGEASSAPRSPLLTALAGPQRPHECTPSRVGDRRADVPRRSPLAVTDLFRDHGVEVIGGRAGGIGRRRAGRARRRARGRGGRRDCRTRRRAAHRAR